MTKVKKYFGNKSTIDDAFKILCTSSVENNIANTLRKHLTKNNDNIKIKVLSEVNSN
jgi:hypothetical protein